MELLLVKTILHGQTAISRDKHQAALKKVFLKLESLPELAFEMRSFIKKVVRKSNLISKEDITTLQWACSLAVDILRPFSLAS